MLNQAKNLRQANSLNLDNVAFNRLLPVLKNLLGKESLRSKKIILKYLCEQGGIGLAKDYKEAIWDEAIDEAINECWLIFKAQPPILQNAIAESSADTSEDQLAPLEQKMRIAKLLIWLLLQTANEAVRDREYANLRAAISRIKENEKPVFQTRALNEACGQTKMGLLYAPATAPDLTHAFTQEELKTPEELLAPPDPAIRKPRFTPDGHGAGGVQASWRWEALKPEALRFWQAFIDYRRPGQPGLIPLYAFYRWLKKYFDLSGPVLTSMDAPLADEENATLHDYLAGSSDLEKELVKKEIRTLACDLAHSLHEKEARALHVYYSDDGALKDVAQALGLAHPSSAKAFMDRLTAKLKKYFSMRKEWSLNNELKEYFIINLLAECKNRSSSPN